MVIGQPWGFFLGVHSKYFTVRKPNARQMFLEFEEKPVCAWLTHYTCSSFNLLKHCYDYGESDLQRKI